MDEWLNVDIVSFFPRYISQKISVNSGRHENITTIFKFISNYKHMDDCTHDSKLKPLWQGAKHFSMQEKNLF